MTRAPLPPPLPSATAASGTPDATHAHVHEAHAPAPGPGHNGLSRDVAALLRTSVGRLVAIDRQIAELNDEKPAIYDTLRAAGLDVSIARKAARRLQLEREKREKLEADADLLDLYLDILQGAEV